LFRVSNRLAVVLVLQAAGLLLSGCSSKDAEPDAPPPPPGADTTAPSVPTGINAAGTSPTQVTLTWNASTDSGAGATGVAGYRVYRDGNPAQIGTTATTTYMDGTVVANTTYSYSVLAYDAATPPNESGMSGAVSATTPPAPIVDTTPPSVPTDVVATAVVGSSTQISITWSASIDASGISAYRVFRNGAQITTTPTTNYTDNGLAPATTYTYTIVALDAANPPNASAASTGASATTNVAAPDTTPPAAPTNVNAAALSDTSIRVTWTPSTDPSGIREYRIFRNGGATAIATVASPGVAHTDTALTANTTYTYTVIAVDNAPAQNASLPSLAASATTNAAPPPPDATPPTPPGGFTATVTGTTSIRLNWTASTDTSGIAEYRLFRAGVAAPIATLNANTFTFTDTGLTPSTLYSYSIFAVDNANPANVSASSTASATTNTAPDILPPSVPTNLAANVLSSTSIQLTWTASTDASGISGYRVFQNGTQIAIASATNYTVMGLSASTTYSFAVAAVDASPQANVSAQTAPIDATTNNVPPDITPPAPPTNVTAVAQSSSAILVSWTAATDPSGISVYRVFRNGGATPIATVNGATTSYTDTALTPSTAYTYTVRAVDGAPAPNESGNSTPASATTLATPDVTPPTTPMNVVATAQSASAIRITWSASTDDSGIFGYSVFRDGGATPIAMVTATNYTDNGLTASTLYTYTVRAVDNSPAANVSALSTAASATTQATPPPVDTTPPTVPSNVTAVPQSSTSVLVSWAASTDMGAGVAGYHVYRNGGATPIATVAMPGFTDTGLTGGVTYTYSVSAFDAAPIPNTSAQSPAVNATPPDTTAPSVPSNVTAVPQSSTTVLVSWAASTDAGSGVAGYRVFRDGGGTPIATVTTTNYTDTGLTGGTTYSYRVSAIDNATPANVSALSTAATATPPDTTAPAAPANVTAVAQSSSSILVSWSASTDISGISGYRVFRDGGGSPVATVTTLNFTDTGLAASTQYTYTVRAVDNSPAQNVSALSTSANATTQAASGQSGLDTRPSNTTCLAGDAPSSGLSIAIQQVYSGVSLSEPVKLLQEPNDSTYWYVVQQTGQIIRFANTGAAGRVVWATIPGVARVGTESGFLGMTFHPNFPTDNRVFVSYNAQNGGQLVSRISSFTTSNNGDTFNSGTEQILLTVNQPDDNHKGGDIAFGTDGNLYIGFGDGGSADDFGTGHNAIGNGQYRGTLLGKMLRITIGAAGQPYTIPGSNPFAGGAMAVNGACSGNCPEIYATGFRNPWRWSFDKVTGEMWVGDVGQNEWEEVDRVVLGGNYGWRCREGAHSFSGNCGNFGPYTDPVAEYDHNAGFAVSGGYVYRGTQIPALVGRYVFADYATGTLWTVPNTQNPTLRVTSGLNTGYSVSSFGQGNDGELYIVDYTQGRIGKIVQGAGGGGRVIPTQLSATGCVVAASPQQPASGLIPFAPNAPFFSDSSVKNRWMALPNGTQFTVETNNDFTFPIGTVMMKNFTLGTTLVETRLFMRHNDGSWAGYTYEWNAAGTDATRVIGGKTVTVNGATWDFPSEAQCLVCHTAVAGRTLGPEVGSFNGDLLYPTTGRTANQLTTHNTIATLTPLLTQPPSALPVIPNPFGAAPLAERARAYLHANCSYCHQPGGPTSVNLDFRYTTTLLATNSCDVAPSAGDLGIANARRIALGDASRSVVVARINRLDAFAMPPLMRHTIDTAGVQLLTDWVNGLASCN
jgi:uncharacterized repeat protein (TIGR03806 family)